MDMNTKYAIIGLGKVGLTLARHLYKRGCLGIIVSQSADYYNLSIEFKDIVVKNNIDNQLNDSDIIIIAKADYYIKGTLTELKSTCNLSGKIVIHLSGSMGLEQFEGYANTGAITASAHPYQTFYYPDPEILNGVAWGVQTSGAFQLISDIIEGFGGQAIDLSGMSISEKILYHASAVAISNYMTTITELSKSIANQAGIQADEFIPKIMRTTLENNIRALTESNDIPLTGPIARGDIEVIERHIKALEENKVLQKSYSLIGMATAEIAYKQNILGSYEYQKIIELLKKYQ